MNGKKSFAVVVLLALLFILFTGSFSALTSTPGSQEYMVDEEPPWPCLGGNPQRTGQSPYDTSHVEGIGAWRLKLGEHIIRSSPSIGLNGTVYIGGSGNNKLYAVDPDGTLLWTYSTEGKVDSSPAIGTDDTIYFGTHNGYFYALNPDRTVRWIYNTDGHVSASPVIGSDGTIYLGTREGTLIALNTDGTPIWEFNTSAGLGFYSSPTVGTDDTIYIGEDEKLYAINTNGTLKWSYTTGGIISSSPAVDENGTIYIGSYDGKLYAINPDGTRKWLFGTKGQISSSPAISSDGTIYIGSQDGNLYALSPHGTLNWFYTTGYGIIASSPAIGMDGTVYVGSYDSKLYAINPDGTLKWSFRTQGPIYSSPAIGMDGTVYVGSNDGYLYAFGDGHGINTAESIYGTLRIFITIAIGMGIAVLFFGHTTSEKFGSKEGEPTSKFHGMKGKVDPRILVPGVVFIILGLAAFYHKDSAHIHGFPSYPFRDAGLLCIFFGALLSTISTHMRKLNVLHTYSLPSTVRENTDVIGLGIIFIFLGLFFTFYAPFTFLGSYVPIYPYRTMGLLILFVGMIFVVMLFSRIYRPRPLSIKDPTRDDKRIIYNGIRADFLIMALILFISGIYFYFHNPLTEIGVYGYPFYPFRTIGVILLYGSVVLSMAGVRTKKYRRP